MKKKNWAHTDLDHVWHPFTQMKTYQTDENLILVQGDGAWLEDMDGNTYFDGVSSLWTNVHGHRHPALDRALMGQAHRLAHSTLLGVGNKPAAALAERLAGLTPGHLGRVFFSDNGSTAAEVAMKMCFQAWRHRGATGEQRTEFVALGDSYHGDTIGSVSAGGMELFHGLFHPLLFKTHFLPSPNCYRCPMGKARGRCGFECARALGPLLDEAGDRVCAMIVEPMVQGAGGILVYPPEVLRIYRDETARCGIPLIVDEVATGFGRTGRMFASEHAGIEPDLITVAKGLTGGYLPVAATLAGEKIYEAFLADYAEFKTFFHGHTYTGNPLGCAVALANLDEIEGTDLVARVAAQGKVLEERLMGRLSRHSGVGDIRLLGFMGAVELVANRATKARFPVAARTGHQVILKAREAGILLRPLGDVIVVMPPLASTEAELEFLVDGLTWAIEAVLGTTPGQGKSSLRTLPAIPKIPRRGRLDLLPGPRPVPTPPRILVTGTDTGVGKTMAAAALGLAAQAHGLDISCWKPVESGVPRGKDEGPDQALYRALSLAGSQERWPTAGFRDPVSPHLAARNEGRTVDVDGLVRRLRGGDEPLLIEGAGGLMVPLDGTSTWADLALRADLGVIVIAPNRLGCLNQVFSVSYLLRVMGIKLCGVILNQHHADATDLSAGSNADELARYLGDLFLGVFPDLKSLDSASLAPAATAIAQKLWGFRQ